MVDVRGLAERSGFHVERTPNGYRIVEDKTGRALLNRDGTEFHTTAAQIYETLTERL